MTPRNYEIVDCGAFCEVIFFCISPKNLPGDFFDSLSRIHNILQSTIESHPSGLFARDHDRHDNFHNPVLFVDKRHFSDHLCIKGQGKKNPVHPNKTEKRELFHATGINSRTSLLAVASIVEARVYRERGERF